MTNHNEVFKHLQTILDNGKLPSKETCQRILETWSNSSRYICHLEEELERANNYTDSLENQIHELQEGRYD